MRSAIVGVLTILAIGVVSLAVGCGGSSGDNNNTNLGQPLSASAKAYKAAVQIPSDVMSQLEGGYPEIVPKSLGPKAAEVQCVESGGELSCEMQGDSGSCTVTVVVNEAEDGYNLDLECDNYTYTDDGDVIVIDGNYSVEASYSGNEGSGILSMLVTTPGGFSISVNNETFTYGSDFQLIVTITSDVSDNSVIVSIIYDVSGTVNGEYVDVTMVMTCTVSGSGEVTCTQGELGKS